MDGFSRCSSQDPEFEVIDFPPRPNTDIAPITGQGPCTSRRKFKPLSKRDFDKLFDEDGRINDEHLFRKLVFEGGIDPSIRNDAWKFLFGFYPFNSTFREREVLLIDYHSRYHALKSRWKEELSKDTDTATLTRATYLSKENEPKEVLTFDLTSELQMQKVAADIQAKVYAGRQSVDTQRLKKAIRIIDKDVPRTDRQLPFFGGEDNPNLYRLRDILITYSAFHFDVGYAQGMNDVVGRFMVVLQSHVEAYWCFMKFMEKIYTDFMEEGMLRKINLVRDLLQELDPDLLKYLEHCEVGDLVFCHRWLLLGFKREFTHTESLKCFEILSSHHLELSSMVAERIRWQQRTKDFEKHGGKCRLVDTEIQKDYTFELFMCIALLVEHRSALFKCEDTTAVFQAVNSLTMKIDLDSILGKAEMLFSRYCSKSVIDDFQLIEMESGQKAMRYSKPKS